MSSSPWISSKNWSIDDCFRTWVIRAMVSDFSSLFFSFPFYLYLSFLLLSILDLKIPLAVLPSFRELRPVLKERTAREEEAVVGIIGSVHIDICRRQ